MWHKYSDILNISIYYDYIICIYNNIYVIFLKLYVGSYFAYHPGICHFHSILYHDLILKIQALKV